MEGLGETSEDNFAEPKSGINFVLYNSVFDVVKENTGYLPVDDKINAIQMLATDRMVMQEAGFIEIFVDNQAQTPVYYDNFMVTHRGGSGPVMEVNAYYPFGALIPGLSISAWPDKKNYYKYNGKELQEQMGLNWLDYGARMYDPEVGRWWVPDPLAEKFYAWSPYSYCFNNPIRFIDPDGRAPGDRFKSEIAAAKDFGKYYNGPSILRNKEFGSTIYYQSDGKGGGFYSYTVANMGIKNKTILSIPTEGQTPVAGIHSHGAWDEENMGTKYDSKSNVVDDDGNNNFSNRDKTYNYDKKRDGYLVTPEGSLKKYNVETAKTETISTDMPSDPNAKGEGRKNKIEPYENLKLKFKDEELERKEKQSI